MSDRYLYRGKKFGMSKTSYGDGWAIGHLIETPKVGNHRSGWSIADYTANPPRITYDDIDPATIGQCTGLKDKNGALIFEGDIVKTRSAKREYIGEVEYNQKQCRYFIYMLDEKLPVSGERMWVELSENTAAAGEKIGNIHEETE